MSTTVPKRQALIQEMLDRFGTISTSNSYRTNIGRNFQEWTPLRKLFETGNLPAGILVDEVADTEKQNDPYDERFLTVKITILAKTAKETRSALFDVIEAIGVDEQWNGLAIQTILVSDALEIDQEERIVLGMTLTLIIHIRTGNYGAT